ncbi:TPA: hypothetical protein MIQ32_16010 [Klebsiella quasipneumoniae]|nr:hypothetical protein [Klebsiella quasipneumoniae]
MQEGGDAANPQELTQVSDWGSEESQHTCNLKYDGYKCRNLREMAPCARNTDNDKVGLKLCISAKLRFNRM